jgi:hypothetical protein
MPNAEFGDARSGQPNSAAITLKIPSALGENAPDRRGSWRVGRDFGLDVSADDGSREPDAEPNGNRVESSIDIGFVRPKR